MEAEHCHYSDRSSVSKGAVIIHVNPALHIYDKASLCMSYKTGKSMMVDSAFLKTCPSTPLGLDRIAAIKQSNHLWLSICKSSQACKMELTYSLGCLTIALHRCSPYRKAWYHCTCSTAPWSITQNWSEDVLIATIRDCDSLLICEYRTSTVSDRSERAPKALRRLGSIRVPLEQEFPGLHTFG